MWWQLDLNYDDYDETVTLRITGTRSTYKYKTNSKLSNIRRSVSSGSSDDEKSVEVDGDGGGDGDESSSDDDDAD